MLNAYAIPYMDESEIDLTHLDDTVFPLVLLEGALRFSPAGFQSLLADPRAIPLLNAPLHWPLFQESVTLLSALSGHSSWGAASEEALLRLDLLLRAGADPCMQPLQQRGALSCAFQNGWLDGARVLAQHTPASGVNWGTLTPLMVAVKFFEVYDLAMPGSTAADHLPLLDFAAELCDVNARDKDGLTALMRAAQSSSGVVCQWLAPRCDIELASPEGWRALHFAAGCEYLDAHRTVEVLLQAQAQPDALTVQGLTAFDVAIAKDAWACADRIAARSALPRVEAVVKASTAQRYPRAFARFERDILRSELSLGEPAQAATRLTRRNRVL